MKQYSRRIRTMILALVIMALVTTVMTTPILLRAMRGTELEESVVASGADANRLKAGRTAVRNLRPSTAQRVTPSGNSRSRTL